MKKENEITSDEKMVILSESPEMISAIKILVAAFIEMKLNNHMRFTYKVQDSEYEITFLKTGRHLTPSHTKG